MDEALTRAWASWRTVCRHPAPTAWMVRTALNAAVAVTALPLASHPASHQPGGHVLAGIPPASVTAASA